MGPFMGLDFRSASIGACDGLDTEAASGALTFTSFAILITA